MPAKGFSRGDLFVGWATPTAEFAGYAVVGTAHPTMTGTQKVRGTVAYHTLHRAHFASFSRKIFELCRMSTGNDACTRNVSIPRV